MSTTTPTNQLPLPHFLNLPLPTIPTNNSQSPQPLMFKLTLSADQFAELLRADGEVEEGEEGGLRLEFESSGKGNLHLSPTSVLPLASPRSGLPTSNKPEEIYQHQQQPGLGRVPLTGLMRIPVGTPTFEVHRPPPPPPVVPVTAPAPVTAPVPPRLSPPEPAQTRSTAMAPPLSDQRQKERLAGQRLKEKRMEEERRKKEKQMVVLTDAPAIPVAKKGKAKAKTGAAKNVVDRSRSKALPPKPATLPAAPLPIRRALPGSATGKQLASEHNNQHLHASTANTPTITLNNPPPLPAIDTSAHSASILPPAPTQARIPSPQPTTYKRSSSNKRGNQKSTPPSNASDETSTADNTAKLSATTAMTSLSEGSESELSRSNAHPDPMDRGPPKSISSASQPSPSEPIRKSVSTAKPDLSKTRKEPLAAQESFLPPPPAPTVKPIREPSPLPPAPMPVSATSLPVAPLPAKKKMVKKGLNGKPTQAKRVIKSSATVHSDDDDEDDDTEREEQSRRESDVINRRAPSTQVSTVAKKRRPLDESTTRYDEPSSRPAKLARTDSGTGSTGQATRRTDSPSGRLQAGSEWDDPRQKRNSAQPIARNSSVVVRKVASTSTERAPSPANKPSTQTNMSNIKKKRPLEDGAASGPAMNGSQAPEKEPEVRRSHPMGVVLPTIRKIQAATEDGRGSGQSDNDSKDHHGPSKKKKKKRTVDYTSSEDEASAPTPQAGLNGTQTNNTHLAVKRDPSPRPPLVSEVSSQSNATKAIDESSIKKTKSNGDPILPSFKRQSQTVPSIKRAPIEDKPNSNLNRTISSSSESEQEEIEIRNSNGYTKARLRFYWLTCHYGYLIDKLNSIRLKKIYGIGLEEIKEMLEEVKCLEEELSIRKHALERYGESLKNGDGQRGK
ncbi:uncharacterized protein MELLADRAFT_117711 [Melampsora larici-populina 98AG31]|uniref:Uncharacterized protein n=1 Tax=Melampsora larici-populina (strain 98AG31 / pathotype 3-4-7) TaxID=747676 RepID=F4S0M5_MELLP|nr:uncharacterized protein MELLADRAFT_117711 [Melampsora larici-populina 98AG31]EGG01841.1 hypothetical protein MELLADRAFT_117711 [Melampsora larici-populina 98AG31]